MIGRIKLNFILSLFGLTVVAFTSYLVILFAKGYRPDLKNGTIKPTGILAISSLPDNAKLYLNGQFKTATKAILNLDPGSYTVEVKKDGFSTWKKKMIIEPEIVSQATAWMFPCVPSFKAVSSTGAKRPTISTNGNSVAFLTQDRSSSKIYTLDLTESPLGLLSRDPKLVATINASIQNLLWSPDSRLLIASATTSAYTIDFSNQSVSQTTNLKALTDSWNKQSSLKESQKFASLPVQLQELLATSAANLIWSPKENKLLYTATASATITTNLKNPLPGSNSQPQTRSITPGGVFVYDLEEDRNFQISTTTLSTPPPKPKNSKHTPTPTRPNQTSNNGWSWFPSDSHLYKIEDNKIYIMEYDGTNSTIVYAGPMEENFSAPYPSGKQLLILTNPTPNLTSVSNLYAVSLR